MGIRINFYGAARNVTGSRFLVEDGDSKLLIDCGLYQGHRKEAEERNKTFQFPPSELKTVLFTHAHLDHTGDFPKLVELGFSGVAYATYATVHLSKYILLDSGHVHEKDIEYINKKRAKKGLPPKEPLYTQKDAEKSLKYFKGKPYHSTFEVEGFNATFYDAGHILGSSQILLEKNGIRILFTGDIGRRNLPIIRDPEYIENVDYIIMESTYGNRVHEDIQKVEGHLARIINETVEKRGKIIIPSFALGRAQEVIYSIHNLIEKEMIPEIPVFVDSPLAVNITDVYRQHKECYDEEMMDWIVQDKDPFGFHRIKYVVETEESKALNHIDYPCVIISASGMCEAGRILHHLKNSIEDERNTVLIVGFMAKNTLGRKLRDGEKRVRIFGEWYEVKARVVEMPEFSAHADSNDLINYLKKTGLKNLKKIFLVHGEEDQQEALAKRIKEELKFDEVYIPELNDNFEIDT